MSFTLTILADNEIFSNKIATAQYENPNIHTSSDTTSLQGFSWTHSLEYAKIALAVAYELGI